MIDAAPPPPPPPDVLAMDAMDAIGLDADDDAVDAAGLFAGALRSPRLIAPH